MQAKSIDEVIEFLDIIILNAIENGDTIGFFPALYRKVTVSVKEAIINGEFENGPRMEKLDVIFANRYLAAYTSYQDKLQLSESWLFAFEENQEYWPIVLQHLLLGMNAHINLDLGIAAARVSPGEEIEDLKKDFNKINVILASLVMDVESELSRIWPTLKKILKWTKKIDDFIINFSMEAARNSAWSFACSLAPLSLENQMAPIDIQDKLVSKASRLIVNPGFIVRALFNIIRIGEQGNVADKIRTLNQPGVHLK